MTTTPKIHTAANWSFDIAQLSAEDRAICVYHLHEGQLPGPEDGLPVVENMDETEVECDAHLIELAALFAHRVLRVPPPEDMEVISILWPPDGELPASVDFEWYNDMTGDEAGGVNLHATYLVYDLKQLAPILQRYTFMR